MAIGERIRYIRNLRYKTQKQLGVEIGFPQSNADVRMAQYESGARTPKADLVEKLAEALNVSTMALDVPNIESYYGVIHTLFTLEDVFGFRIDEKNGEPCLMIDKTKDAVNYHTLIEMLDAWLKQYKLAEAGKISKEEYDNWRYNYPFMDE